jgi:hypothetical protein
MSKKCADCLHFGKHNFQVQDIKNFFPDQTGEICIKMHEGSFWFPSETFHACDKFEPTATERNI